MDNEIEVSNDICRVTLCSIGEGANGDAEEGEVALVRFYVDRRAPGFDMWEEVDSSSYCTRLPENLPPEVLHRAALLILSSVTPNLREDLSIKGLCAQLSWLDPNDSRLRAEP